MEAVKFSLVIPVFKNEMNISPLISMLEQRAKTYGTQLEIIFVVDGSPDKSLSLLLAQLPNTRLRCKVLELSRNFGSFAAIRAGLKVARGDYIAVMAADLQEPFELIEQFFSHLDLGDFDVVIGRRQSRGDAHLVTLASNLFWGLYRKFVVSDVPAGGVDVFAITRQVKEQLLNLNESHSSLIAQIFWVGFKRTDVGYERVSRSAGRSGWNFRKKLEYTLDSIFSFSDLPIKIILAFGSLGSIVLFLFGAFIALARWAGIIEVPGYAALALITLFSAATVLLGLGIVGSYSWRTFENSKSRPLFLIRGQRSFNDS